MNDITDKSKTVKVGSQVPLSAQFKNINIVADEYSWTIPGTIFKEFNENADKNPLVLISPLELTSIKSNIFFYWSDGKNNREVKCTLKLREQQFTGKTSFTILRPTMQVSTDIDEYRIDGDKLQFGGLFKTYGIKFSRNIPDPQFLNDSFCWLQIIKFGKITYNGETYDENKNALDDVFPYSSTDMAVDTPSCPLRNYDIEATHEFHAEMYLMYKLSGTEVISPSWVPIKKIQWSCHGAANFVTNEWLLSMNSRGSVENIIDAVIHPNWEKIVMNH